MKHETARPKAIFTLNQNIINELNEVASELKEKKSHIVEKALTLYFDMLDIRIADKRMKEIESGKAAPISAEEVYKELGL